MVTRTIPRADQYFTPTGARAWNDLVDKVLESAVSVKDYGALGDGTTNDAVAFQNAINAAGDGILYIPDGEYRINSALTISSATRIVGAGVFATQIERNFSPASDSQGLFNISDTGEGASLESLSLFSETGTTGGCLVSILASASNTPSACLIKDAWLSTRDTDTHKYALYVDGSLKDSGAVGVREMRMTNVSIFGGTSGAVFLKSVVGFGWYGGGSRPAGGTSGAVVIDGTAGVPSNYVDIHVPFIGAVTLDKLRFGNFDVAYMVGNLTNTSDTSEVNFVAGLLDGTAETDWVKSLLIESGRVRFSATQNASSNVNTLDDYEEGTFQPAITFATPGDLSVGYTFQLGTYVKVGKLVTASVLIATSSFTHGSANGALSITGLPFQASGTTGNDFVGACRWGGITKANYTNVIALIAGGAQTARLDAMGSGQAASTITAADMPTGGAVRITFTVTYEASS